MWRWCQCKTLRQQLQICLAEHQSVELTIQWVFCFFLFVCLINCGGWFFQVRSMISLQSGGILSFGLAWFSSSEFELMAEEVLMSDSTIKVFLAPACCPSLLFLSCTLLFEHVGIQGSHLRFLQQKFLMYLCLLHLFPSHFFLGTSFFLSQVL